MVNINKVNNWYNDTVDNTISELGTDGKNGLTGEQVKEKEAKYGKNRLKEKKGKTLVQRFFEQLKDFMVIILICAAIISLVVEIVQTKGRHVNLTEPLVILGIVILNAVLGVMQESKAQAALDALRNLSAPKSKVLRGGFVQVIPAEDIVPGDIVLIEAGDMIPADGRLIESAALSCDESALTGESLPVEKNADAVLDVSAVLGDRTNMVYSGCCVNYGRGRFAVTATGMETEIGRIAGMLANEEDTATPLQKKLAQLGKKLGLAAIIICIIIFVVGASSGSDWLSVFMTAVSLAVAAIPEGLPAIVTISLALGVQRMVKRRAIIRKLPAVETLGGTSVICSDKTGTLTLNQMTLVQAWSYRTGKLEKLSDGAPDDSIVKVIQLAALCSDGSVKNDSDGKRTHIGDPTETAIVAALLDMGQTKDELEKRFPRVSEIPFDSDRKLMTTVHHADGRTISITKGAPEILLSRCTGVDVQTVNEVYESMAKNALRVLAVAFKDIKKVPENPDSEELENCLTFAGLIGMIDPPREEARAAIRLCEQAGIRTVMITGDHIVTACAIARDLGIMRDGDEALTGQQLSELSDSELFDSIRKYSVYARVTPSDKIRIVKAWQEAGETVAMTGDGVNDAPALKAADIGCAMGITGTDVAKGAADLTLTDDNFATIVDAVREGRGIFDNIKKSVQFLLSCNLGEIITVFICMLIYKVSPLAAMHLLLINIITDSLPALALSVEPEEPDIMERLPRRKDEGLLDQPDLIRTGLYGALIGILTIIAYAVGHAVSVETAQTMAFGVLALSQLFHVLNLRTSHTIFSKDFIANRYMLIAEGISLFITLAVMLIPGLNTAMELVSLSGSQWLTVLLLSLVPVAVCELVKLVRTYIREKTENR